MQQPSDLEAAVEAVALTGPELRMLHQAADFDGRTAGADSIFVQGLVWAHSAGLVRMVPLTKWTVRLEMTPAGRAMLEAAAGRSAHKAAQAAGQAEGG